MADPDPRPTDADIELWDPDGSNVAEAGHDPFWWLALPGAPSEFEDQVP